MASMNRVILVGRLTKDPEKRYTSSGLAVTTFSIAVDRPFKDQATGEKKTDFFRCKAWRQKAEFVEEYVRKGRLVGVDGRIETSEIVGQDGVKKYFTDIVCDNVELLESARDNVGDAAPSGNYNGASQARSNSGGGGNSNGGGNSDGDGYFADEELAPVRQSARPAAAAPAQRPAAQPAQRPAPAKPAAKPADAYPADDFDDSDPFADE